MCCYEMGAFQAMPGYFFFFLKSKYIISTYVSVSFPCFFILFQRSVWAAKKEWRVHRARSARFPTVAFDLGLCGFYLTVLFSSLHVQNQANFEAYIPHMCCSWSSHLHPGESMSSVQNRHAHTCMQTAVGWKITWRGMGFFLLLVGGRERRSRRSYFLFFFKLQLSLF